MPPSELVVAANGPDSLIWWDWVSRHPDDIAVAVQQHLVLTGIAVGAGLAVSAPLALLARRYRRTQGPILAVTGVIYTIPSIALFFLLGPFTGYASRLTAEVGLISYTLLVLIRNIVAGLDAVPADVREAARGMGYRPLRQLVQVELPLALPTIVAGVRIATVSTIGLVTIAALVGQGGLGGLIYDGLRRDFPTPIVIGSALSILLAVIADVVLLGAQRLLTPWSRSSS